MSFIKKHTGTALFGLLMLVSLSYVYFEWNAMARQQNFDPLLLTEQAVNNGKDRFGDFLFNFSNNATLLSDYVSTQIKNGTPHAAIYNELNKWEDFWNIVIYENHKPIIWRGFSTIDSLRPGIENHPAFSTQILRVENVDVINSRASFIRIGRGDTLRYMISASQKLRQENILPIGNSLEVNPAVLFGDKRGFPIHISFDAFVPENTLAYSFIETPTQKNIGIIYALASDLNTYKSTQSKYYDWVRAWFWAALLVCFFTIMGWLIRKMQPALRLVGQWAFLGAAWWLGNQILPFFGNTNSIHHSLLGSYLMLIILLLAFWSWFSFVRSQSSKKSMLISSLVTGALFQIGLFAVLNATWDDSSSGVLFLFNPTEIITGAGLVFQVAYGYVFIGLLFFLGRTCQYILIHKDQLSWINGAALIIGVLFSILILSFIPGTSPLIVWIAFLSLISVPTAMVLLHLSGLKNRRYSYLRRFLFLNFLASSALFTVALEGSKSLERDRLQNALAQFIEQDESDIQQVATQLLGEVELNVQQNLALSTAQFTQMVEPLIRKNWSRYSLSVQLIDTLGTPIAEYTNNLSAPQWSTDFRIEELVVPFQIERIRRQNLRPVIRTQPLNASSINARYSAFRRGWIPIFGNGDTDNIQAWVLASVYKLIPEFNRPLRTVISSSLERPDEPSISLVEFENRQPVRTAIIGTPIAIPGYNALPLKIERQSQKDAAYFMASEIRGVLLNEVYRQTPKGSIIRAASRQITLTQSLFVFLRLYFILIIPYLLVLLLLGWNNKWSLMGYSRRIRDRLIDRFLVASLLYLLVLAGLTYTILNRQNTVDVQQELLERLSDLVDNMEANSGSDYSGVAYLNSITELLSEDAALYIGGGLVNSTTPQIYSQHLLPKSVPWQVYNNILENNSEQEVSYVQLDDFEMMIGYQPWFVGGKIAGIAAIPTFLKTPKFYEQLLSTTGYFIAFFSIIFGLLMLSIGWIANRMTAPLQTLREGLRLISNGDMDTNLPITSNDEIGMLTHAYNAMTQRLRELQKELAKSEREAAWKEMAQQVAHEIKNPLTPMKLNLQHLERQLHLTGEELSLDKPKISAITNSMIEQIEALNKIASDFSKFAKPIKQAFADISINDVVQSVADLYLNEPGIELSLKLDKQKFIISGVNEELRRALINLVKNGIEAMEGSGTITIKTYRIPHTRQCRIELHDTGGGISDEHRHNIFTPNFSTKTSGTGLGLAITKQIIEEHQGSISFNTKPGKSTTFIIDLPLK